MAARLAALGDDDVGPRRDRRARLLDVHDLLDPQHARVVRPGDEIGRHVEVERDRGRPELEGGREGGLVEGPDRVVDREGPRGPGAQLGPLGDQLGRGPQAGAEGAEGARLADRRGELDLPPRAEWGAGERHVDAQEVADRGAEHTPAYGLRGAGARDEPQALREHGDHDALDVLRAAVQRDAAHRVPAQAVAAPHPRGQQPDGDLVDQLEQRAGLERHGRAHDDLDRELAGLVGDEQVVAREQVVHVGVEVLDRRPASRRRRARRARRSRL